MYDKSSIFELFIQIISQIRKVFSAMGNIFYIVEYFSLIGAQWKIHSYIKNAFQNAVNWRMLLVFGPFC